MKKLKYTLAIVAFLFSLSVMASGKSGDVKEGFEIGDKLPNITAKSYNGEEMQLSSLQGKMVLVDFWASWCPPCRAENPRIVSAYNKFKDADFKNGDGFTVFSFSLDKKLASWKAAIDKDKLSWKTHVSELQGWNSPTAESFGIRSIPSNFLIDANGIILAKNLRGEKLELVLQHYLK